MAEGYATFLNGVCRHELKYERLLCFASFLNGVCRHELDASLVDITSDFLNGVCRHERLELSSLNAC